MTDKVQKIRENVVWLMSNHDSALDYEAALEDVLNIIDSTQEEPTIPDIVDEHFYEMLGEEPVSEDLEQAIDTYLATYFGGEKEKQDWPFLKKMAIHFANWQKQQLLAKAIDGHVTFEFYGLDSKTYGTIAHDPICLDDLGLKDTDKVKVIVIKED